MTDIRQKIHEAIQLVEKGQLMEALHMTQPVISIEPYLVKGEQLEDIYEDYHRMLVYMRSGFVDPQRDKMYQDLLARMYRLLIHYEIEWRCTHENLFGEARRRRLLMSHDEQRAVIEGFVSDVALASLDEWSTTDNNKTEELYKHHQQFVSQLFYTLLISRQWRTEDADFYKTLLLSPTIDSNDAQVITAAVMLACINEYDPLKFKMLTEVYCQSTDDHVKQRALVGWVLSMREHPTTEEQALIDGMVSDEGIARDLIDLQKQLLFTVSAEKDTETIQREIMPTLIKNNQFNITRDGIVEKEEDPMQDILDPDADDRKMEEVEQMVRQMQQMQNAGSDVYFGGFSQMKRFSFFYDLSNWFTPYYIQHPGIAGVVDKLDSLAVLRNIAENGPFCDSDKYSFTLAISTIINQLPDNIKEMMGNADVLGPTIPQETMTTPTYIRRMYLQDLYRFFKLFTLRNELRNPLANHGYLFLHDHRFDKMSITSFRSELARFYHQRHDGVSLKTLVRYLSDEQKDADYFRGLCAYYYQNDYPQAVRYFEKIVNEQPDNHKVMAMLARCYMQGENYEKAINIYSKLLLLYPDNQQYELNLCVALCRIHSFDEAVEHLYRLHYEHGDDLNVQRILAWALMGQNRLGQADEMYAQVTANEHHEAVDYLNHGYCKWFENAYDEAVACFKNYLKEQKVSKDDTQLSKEFDADRQTLYDHGIMPLDITLMLDMVRGMD